MIQGKNKLDYYGGKDCMKNFCKDLKKHARKIINCEKKKRNDTINKWGKTITLWAKCLLYMQKRI